MRHQSQTFIGLLRTAVNTWRTRDRLGQATVVDLVVSVHERLGYDDVTGIRFEPNTRDTFERMKVNGERVFRWLDDETKDSTLLPTNFIPSILAALPPDLRLDVLDSLLAPFGLVVRAEVEEGDPELCVHAALGRLMSEDAKGQQAVLRLATDTSDEAVQEAHRELREAVGFKRRLMRTLGKLLTKRKRKV